VGKEKRNGQSVRYRERVVHPRCTPFALGWPSKGGRYASKKVEQELLSNWVFITSSNRQFPALTIVEPKSVFLSAEWVDSVCHDCHVFLVQ
jgi:hypothetical protein